MENGYRMVIYGAYENESRSCSTDLGCITPTYVYRLCDGTVELENIVKGPAEIGYYDY